MKRILSLTLSLLMLMSMVTIVGAADDSNVVWQENFNDGVTIGAPADTIIPFLKDGTADDTMKIWENDNHRQVNLATVTLPQGAYGKGNHEKSLFMKFPSYSGGGVTAYFEATFPNELPIAEAKTGHIGFDWINFSTADNGTRDQGRRAVNLKVKFVNGDDEHEAYVKVGTLTSNIFTHADNGLARGQLATWNRLSLYVQNDTAKVSAVSGDTWHSVTITAPTGYEGYTPVAVTGIQIGVGFERLSPEHFYGLDNFIAEKVDAMPTGSASSGEAYPIFVPFVDTNYQAGVLDLKDMTGRTLAKGTSLSFSNALHASVTLPYDTTAALHTRSFLTFDAANWNHLSDHEVIIENAAGYFIPDSETRASVMGSDAYTMTDSLNLGRTPEFPIGSKIHYGFKFKYTGATPDSDHILMKFQPCEGGNRVHDVIRMKSDGTLIDVAGNALTTLAADTYHKVDVLFTIGEPTEVEVYINGKHIDTVTLPTTGAVIFHNMLISYFGEPKGEAEEKMFGDVTASAIEYYAHSLHIDDVYINNVATTGAFNKTPYVAYDLNKSLSEASDNIAKYGIVLDPGSMTASRVSDDWTAASFLAAINLPNVSVVDADGTALTGDEALVGNKIKITGDFAAPVYYTAVATGANIADTDFVLEATQNGDLLGATCAEGSAVTVKAVDDDYATPQIFVAEYQTVNGKLNLVSCKGGTGSASLTPSAAGNTVKVFVVSTNDGLQPLYNTNLTFTVQ